MSSHVLRARTSQASSRDGSTQSLWSRQRIEEWPSQLRLVIEPEPEMQTPPLILDKKCDPSQVSFPAFSFLI